MKDYRAPEKALQKALQIYPSGYLTHETFLLKFTGGDAVFSFFPRSGPDLLKSRLNPDPQH